MTTKDTKRKRGKRGGRSSKRSGFFAKKAHNLKPAEVLYRPDPIITGDWWRAHLIMSMRYSYKRSRAAFRAIRVGQPLTITTNEYQKPMAGHSQRHGVVVQKGHAKNKVTSKSLCGFMHPVSIPRKERASNGRKLKPRYGSQPNGDNVNSLVPLAFGGDTVAAERLADWSMGMQLMKLHSVKNRAMANPKNWTRGKHGGEFNLFA